MLIAPSILSSDFSRLEEEIKKLEKAGADLLHLDVMDGHFVPNITFGAPVIKSIRKCTELPFDVHLMIENPEKYIDDFLSSGADILTFHIESTGKTLENIEKIKKSGKKIGISLKPKTDLKEILPFLDKIDVVLVMSVEPGFSGQKFIPSTVDKIKKLRKIIDDQKLSTKIEVDGGINPKTVNIVKEAGAEICVAGDSVFKSQNYTNSINLLKNTNWRYKNG